MLLQVCTYTWPASYALCTNSYFEDEVQESLLSYWLWCFEIFDYWKLVALLANDANKFKSHPRVLS